MHPRLAAAAKAAIPLHAVTAATAKGWLVKQAGGRLLAAAGFTGAAGELAALSDGIDADFRQDQRPVAG